MEEKEITLQTITKARGKISDVVKAVWTLWDHYNIPELNEAYKMLDSVCAKMDNQISDIEDT